MSLYVRYLDFPVGVQEGCTLAGTGGQPFSDPQRLAAGAESRPWATLEAGGWPLDGSRQLIRSAPDGWWSAAPADETGALPEGCRLSLTLAAPCTATGLTLTFDPATGQHCREIHARWYGGTALLAEQTAFPDGAEYVLPRTVEAFDRVVLELRAAAPGQFAKLTRIQVGQLITLGRDELVKVRLLAEVDPGLCETAADSLTVEIRDRHGRSYAPQQRQILQLWRDDTQLAQQHITGSTREGPCRYRFACQSVIGLLEDEFLGGLYRAVPLETLLAEILTGYDYTVAPAFAGAAVTGYLPVCTRRQALQQVCLAVGAMLTTQLSGVVQLIPIPELVDAVSIRSGSIFPGASLATEARVGRVDVWSHSYAPGTEQETLLSDETVAGEDLLYTFGAPHRDYRITGGTITGSGDNWVTLTADGPVTLTGAAYTHSVRVHTRRSPSATAAERSNTVSVEQATLVHAGNAGAVLDRLYAHCLLRQTLTERIVAEGQRAGQLAVSQNPWGGQTRGILTAMDMTLTPSGTLAEITIVGAAVELPGAAYYAGELYAGEEALY